ncbi:SbcC/MukB-like Walker B domain-containing protein, partial [Kineosporia sp. A_224]|uniref:SbcC/MukB-like Walker B domain-containing protein n=1 Tax=Kineosporia sp. A_224 TaxID=1962180 RepID=UPI0026F45C9D
DLAGRVAAAAAAREQADAAGSRVAERADGLRERVDRARGDDPSVAARRDRLRAWADAAEGVLDARRGLADASVTADRATAAAATAARAAGFDDVIDCVRAVLSREQTDAYTAALRARDDELAAVTKRLEDGALVAAAAAPEPQPETAAALLELARADEADAVRTLAHAEEAVRALDGIAAELDAHLATAAPVHERFAVLDGLSRCLDGTGGENSRRMPLSAFVLAARLEQVAEAASLRLAQMSAGRYALVHSDVAEKGARRAGLALQVVDAWTGQRRDTASLSGGESFYTSLALALGLADVVSAESGGTTIETLFVDEGFGSLDEDTLEEVMDVLDDLRSGGRVVGLVSHVADLRDRMPARLEVVKGRTGSTLRLAVPA